MRLVRVTLASLVAAVVIGWSVGHGLGGQAGTPLDGPGEVGVITSGAFEPALDILGPLFQEATGIDVIISYGSSMGDGPQSIPSRVARGAAFDVLIMSRPSLDRLTNEGHVRPASRVNLARSEIGMALRSGAPHPDISTREAFIEAMLAAESIGYSESVSGTYLSTDLFPELGIWDEIEPKARRIATPVAAAVARGEVEIGFQQVSEILGVNGVDLAGTLPAELQLESWFGAGITRAVQDSESAQRLIDFLNSEAAAPIIEWRGLHPNPN